MTEWIVPCNPNLYRVDDAFAALKKLDWKQTSPKMKVGDIVYIYVSKPVRAIRYKCKVTKVNLKEIEIPSHVSTLSSKAFYGCSNLTRVKLPKNLKKIKSSVFQHCSALKEIELPKGLEIIGLDDVDSDIIVFHAGTKEVDSKIVTNGGRVLNVCTTGNSLEEVRNKIYNAIEKIDFDGKYCRKDIGLAK